MTVEGVICKHRNCCKKFFVKNIWLNWLFCDILPKNLLSQLRLIRSMSMRIKKTAFLTVLITAALLFGLVPVVPAKAVTPFIDLEAQAAILAEAETGALLYENNMNKRHPVDYLSKVMTLLLAVDAAESGLIDTGDIVEMTDTAMFDITSKSSTLKIVPGEQMSISDLMYCAFTGGANEACNLIAEQVSGSVDAFVVAMNKRARELGCKNTNFVNTHGQYNDDQYSTALDLFTIYSEAMKHPLFQEISGEYRYTTDSTNRADARRIYSSNSLFNSGGKKYFYRPCSSGIASITYEGGHSFAGYAGSDNLALIVIVLGAEAIKLEDESYEMKNLTEARRLFEWGFAEYGWRTLVSSTELVGKAPVEHGDGADYVNLRPNGEIKKLLAKDVRDDEFTKEVIIYSKERGEVLTAPVKAGDLLGEVRVTRKGVDYGTVPLVANTSVELHRLEYMRIKAAEVLKGKTARTIIWVLAILILGYIALVVRYNVLRIKRMQKIKETKRKLADERRSSNEWTGEDPRLR